MGKLICPLCGSFTSVEPLMLRGKAIHTKLSSDTQKIFVEAQMPAMADYMYPGTKYAILTCAACGEPFVARKEEKYKGEWLAVYPIQHRPVAEEIPEPIKSEFREAHLCFAIEAHRACLAMCGIILEALWREQEASGLKDLKDKGIISLQLYERANEIRLWGNVAKHEPIPDVVTREDSEQLLTYLEMLLDTVYVEPKRLASLIQKREQIEKKKP